MAMSSPTTSPQSTQSGEAAAPTTPASPPANEQTSNAAEAKAKEGDKSKLQEALRERFRDRFGGRPKEAKSKEPEKKEPAAQAKPEEKKSEEKPKKEDVQPEKEDAKPKAEDKPTRVEEALAKAAADSSATAKAALELANRATRPEPSAAPTESAFETRVAALPQKQRDKIAILKMMEKEAPEKYKNLAERYVASSDKLESYRKRWEKDNPGEAFDPKDDRHNDFFAENDVTWDQEDYHGAIASIKADAKISEERKKYDERLREVTAKQTSQELEPIIRKRQASLSKEILKSTAPDLVDLFDDTGNINEALLTKTQEENPFVLDVVIAELQPLAAFIREAEQIYHPSKVFKRDPKNQAQAEVEYFRKANEKMIMELPPEKQLDERRRPFMPLEKWEKLPESDQDKHWTLGKDIIIELRADFAKARMENAVKSIEERLNKYTKAKGLKADEVPKAAEAAEAKEDEKAQPAAAKPKSPSVVPDSKVDTIASSGKTTPGDFRSKLKQRLSGRMM